MQTLFGCVMVIAWVGLGFIGDSIRFGKGYRGGTLAAICWGGPLYFVIALLLPRRCKP